ncbi:MAG: serine/threonine-protein kinase, partial [Planctomycetota bacterium]
MLGTTLGGYRLVSELGSGAMGSVYLAEDTAGRQVAVKVIHPHLLASPGVFKRFLREGEIGKRIRHQNVVRTLDVDASEANGTMALFMVMEYVEGRSLRRLLKDLRMVPEALLREIAGQIAAGLAAVHAEGIIHRDLKPENVLITEDRRIRIMDLGVARMQEASIALTREGHFTGSLPYAAPEQFNREEVGPAADLYSLGVLLYELATGRNPFAGQNAAQVINTHLSLTPPPVEEQNPAISSFFSEVIGALLVKKPADRIESAAALGCVLADGERSDWWAGRRRRLRRKEQSLPRIPVRRDTAAHGRETELSVLHQAWNEAKEGRGRALLLEGEPGVGKTRLVDSFLRSLVDQDVHMLYGCYLPSGGMGGL